MNFWLDQLIGFPIYYPQYFLVAIAFIFVVSFIFGIFSPKERNAKIFLGKWVTIIFLSSIIPSLFIRSLFNGPICSNPPCSLFVISLSFLDIILPIFIVALFSLPIMYLGVWIKNPKNKKNRK